MLLRLVSVMASAYPPRLRATPAARGADEFVGVAGSNLGRTTSGRTGRQDRTMEQSTGRTITGRWQLAETGRPFENDFDLVYRRIDG